MIRSRRIGLAHATLAVFALAILVQAAQVQLIHGHDWRMRAERQQVVEKNVPAPRGEIFDVTRRVLAQSREEVRLEIAPREVTQPRRAASRAHAVERRPAHSSRARSTRRRSISSCRVTFWRRRAAPAMALHGVHSFAAITRSYAASQGAQGILGHVDADNKPVDGLELSLDTILRGVPGAASIISDSKGQTRESPTAPGVRAGEGQQRRADDQRRPAGDRGEVARRRRGANGRRGRRHRHSRSAQRGDPARSRAGASIRARRRQRCSPSRSSRGRR